MLPISILDVQKTKRADVTEEQWRRYEAALRQFEMDVDYEDLQAILKPDPALLEQQKAAMVTFSGAPQPKWAALPNLDTIRRRNKPILPPKKYIAPFFMPTTEGLKPKFVIDDEEDEGKPRKKQKTDDDDEEPKSKILQFEDLQVRTPPPPLHPQSQ